MPLLERSRQHEILNLLASIYPQLANPTAIAESLTTPLEVDSNEFAAEICYLAEHGLISVKTQWVSGGPDGRLVLRMAPMVITAAGMDFLQDDGGLSAILGVVTVRLHEDTIRDLLIRKVEASDGDPTTKGHLVAAIKALPADALKSLAQKALDAGVEHLPGKVELLRGWLGL